MPAGLSTGVTITSRFVAKSTRSVTPGSSCTASIHVPLALAKTSAVPSLWIWPASVSDAAKLKVTVTPSCSASNAGPMRSVNAAVSDDAAKTVSSEAPSLVLAPAQPATSGTTTNELRIRRIAERYQLCQRS